MPLDRIWVAIRPPPPAAAAAAVLSASVPRQLQKRLLQRKLSIGLLTSFGMTCAFTWFADSMPWKRK